MSDLEVAEALRSDAPLVVIEAPAGCGKTFQAADYARWLGRQQPGQRALVLTHTHAACDVFRDRATESKHLHVCTFDGFITNLASIYHRALGLPQDVGRWALEHPNGFETLGERVCQLLTNSRAIRTAIVARYPVVVCDEHQDTNVAQDRIALQILDAGAKLRIFGDPRQAIFGRTNPERAAQQARWASLRGRATRYESLDFPHRWSQGSRPLGEWVLAARASLDAGNQIDLRGQLPEGLRLIRASNIGNPGQFRLDQSADVVRNLVRQSQSLLVLAPTQDLVASIHAFFGRAIRIWEGHTRDALRELSYTCAANAGNAHALGEAMCTFIRSVLTGFTADRRDRCLNEIATGALRPCRGIPAELQLMARCILDSPDHRGVALALQRLIVASAAQGVLSELKIDHHRELREASRLNQFEDAINGQAELTRRRIECRLAMPSRAISTIHKAKGLEKRDVLLMPCDAGTFSATDYKRCVAYVALSRATHSLTIIASPQRPSPLFLLP